MTPFIIFNIVAIVFILTMAGLAVYAHNKLKSLPQIPAEIISSTTPFPTSGDATFLIRIYPRDKQDYTTTYKNSMSPEEIHHVYRPGTRILVRMKPKEPNAILHMTPDPTYLAQWRDLSAWPRVPAVISSTRELSEANENIVFFEIRVRVEPPDAESYETALARHMSIVEVAHDYPPGTRVTVRVCPYAPQIVEELKLDLYPQPNP